MLRRLSHFWGSACGKFAFLLLLCLIALVGARVPVLWMVWTTRSLALGDESRCSDRLPIGFSRDGTCDVAPSFIQFGVRFRRWFCPAGQVKRRACTEAQQAFDGKLSYAYTADVRRYCKDLLKIMLRGEEPTVCDMTICDSGKAFQGPALCQCGAKCATFDKLYKTFPGGGSR